jgi:hypothetical protein
MLGIVEIYHCSNPGCDYSPLALDHNGNVPEHRVENPRPEPRRLLNETCSGSGHKPIVNTIEAELIPAL